jgi:hypothetical protein
MKTKHMLSVATLATLSTAVTAQEQTPQAVSKFKISDAYLQEASFIGKGGVSTLSNFKTLAPQSLLLKNDLSAYSQSGGITSIETLGLSMGLGISLRNKNKTGYNDRTQLRLGIGYYSVTGASAYFSNVTRITYDTLKSATSKEVTYLDSVKHKNYNMNYSSRQLRLDASLIYKSNPDKRWSVFGGIGANASVSLNATTTIGYYEYVGKETKDVNGRTSNSSSYSDFKKNKTETFANKTNLSASAYVPMGVDFRLGKKREFWKHAHLFYELRPSIMATTIPELHTVTIGAGVQQGLGLRITL